MTGTTLQQGQIAIVQLNNNSTAGGDGGAGFEFVLLAPVAAGTTIGFTGASLYSNGTVADNTYESPPLTWTAPSAGLAAGSVVTISSSAGAYQYLDTASTGSLTGDLYLDSAGYRVTAFQGTLSTTSTTSAMLLYSAAVNGTYEAVPGTSNFDAYPYANNANYPYWNQSAPTTSSGELTDASQLPTTLEGYEVAFDGTDVQYNAGLEGAYYNGPTTGSPSQLLADINNSANWVTQANYSGPSGNGSQGGVSAFTTGASAPKITSGAYDAGTGKLTVTGTNLTTSAGDYTISDLSVSAAKGTYPLFSSSDAISGTPTSTGFVVQLSASDQSTVDALLNSGGTLTLSASAGFDTSAGAASSGSLTLSDSGSGPSIGASGGTTASISTSQGTPVAVETGSVTVTGSPDVASIYAGGTFTASISANDDGAHDELSIINTSGGITTSGSTVSYNGTAIGTISATGAPGQALSVALNGNATDADIASLVNAIGISESGTTASTAQRQVTFSVTDAYGKHNGTTTASVNVVAPPSLSVDNVTQYEAASGTTTFDFTVSLSAASTQTVTVNYATADGSAKAGTAYTASSGTLSFSPGQTSQQIGVPVLGGSLTEPSENFSVTLSSPTNATIATNTGTGTIEDHPPTVTAGNINVSGGTGTGGAFKIGDTVTAAWNDSGSGDNSQDVINAGDVIIDFSQFGGGDAAATNSGGIWTATYRISSGSIDSASAHVAVTATDQATNSTTTSSGAVTVDDIQPVVTSGNISVSGGTGTGGAFKIGDTVTATWNDTGNGDNNTDTINAGDVTMDFSLFGGGSAVAATDSSGVWTATYKISSGSIDTSSAHVAVTATDHVGNATTASSAAVTVDNTPPTVTSIDIAGTSPNDATSDAFTVTFSTAVTGVDATDFTLVGTNTVTGTIASVTPINPANGLASTYTISVENVTGDGVLRVDLNNSGDPITDAYGNVITTPHTGDQTYTVDQPPTIVSGGYAVSLLEGGSASQGSGAALTGDVNSNTGSNSGLTVGTVQFGSGAAVAAGVGVGGTYGTLTLNSDGSYTYVADQTAAINAAPTGTHPTETFTYTVSDGTLSSPESFTVTIDRPPNVVAETGSVLAGATLTGAAGAALAGDTDPDGDALSISSVTAGATTDSVTSGSPATISGTYGSLTLNADGSYSYMANNGLAIVTAADGSPIVDAFSIGVSDGNGGVTTSSLAVTISLAAGGTETVTNPTGNATYSIGATTLTLNETSASTYSGVIQDGSSGNTGGGVNVAGTAALTLTGASTYTGATRISGTLDLSGSGSVADASKVSLNKSGATFDISGASGPVSINKLGGAPGSIIDLGANTLSVNESTTPSLGSGAGTFAGVIQDGGTAGGSLVVAGTSALTLTGVDTYTGKTSVAGTLDLVGSGSIRASKKVSLTKAGATFDISGASGTEVVNKLGGIVGTVADLGSRNLKIKVQAGTVDTFAGTIQDGGVVGGSGGSITLGSHGGAGDLSLTHANNSYTGGTTIDVGTLDVAALGAAGTGTITFASPANYGVETLEIDAAALTSVTPTLPVGSQYTFANDIAGASSPNQVIDLTSLAYVQGSTSATLIGTTLNVDDGSSDVTLHLASPQAKSSFTTASDGHGGTLVYDPPKQAPAKIDTSWIEMAMADFGGVAGEHAHAAMHFSLGMGTMAASPDHSHMHAVRARTV